MRSYKTYNRYYVAVLYPEDKKFNKYFENIQKCYTEVTYINHNRDVNENGEIKKEHYHVIFKVGKNPRSINSVAEESEIPINYIEGCNKENMLLYLIHYKKQNKVKYSVNEVQGELKEELMRLLSENKTEEDVLQDILYFINTGKIKDMQTLLSYTINIKRVDIIKKYGYIFTNILREKKDVDKEEKNK